MSKMQSQINTNVAQKGAVSYLQQVDADRRLPAIDFVPMCAYFRAFLKYATVDGNRVGKDAQYTTIELPSHVLIGELLGQPTYNPLDDEGTKGGWVVPNNKRCIDVLVDLAKDIIDSVSSLSPDVSEEEYLTKAAETLDMKRDWIEHFVGYVGDKIKETRPEIDVFGLKEFRSFGSKFQVTIFPVLQDIVILFSKTRTDLITWVAKSQRVSFDEGRFHTGSIKDPSEDDGEQLSQCYKLASLGEAIAIHDFMMTDEGKLFPKPDMASDTFRDAYRKWSTAYKKGSKARIPWQRPGDNPVHFCISAECEIDKSKLIIDNQTKQPRYIFGYYRSSLGENGKMNKILGAAQTGTANNDPDVIELFMGYTTSDDKGKASQGMSISDINLKGAVSQAQITDAFQALAMDTNRKKVRLYDEFSMGDSMMQFRKYILDNKVLEWLDTSQHEDALNLLGIDIGKTDAESLSEELYKNNTSDGQSLNAFSQAAILAQQESIIPPTSVPSVPNVPQSLSV